MGKNKSIIFLIGDALLIPLSVWFSFLLRFEGQIPKEHIINLEGMIFLCLLFCIPFFYFFRLYSFSWSYFSTSELTSLLKAIVFSFSFIGAALFLFRDNSIFLGFPRSTLFISFILISFLSGGMRLSKRLLLQLFKQKQGKENILIVGAGDAGEQVLRGILSSNDSLYRPVGFVDESPQKQGITIHGYKVLGKTENISKIVKEKNVKGLIITESEFISKAVKAGREAGLKKIKIIPPMSEIIGGIPIENLKNLNIEDLLGRMPVLLDLSSIENFISEKRVLVTGAAGSIGSELCYQMAKFKPLSLLVLDQDETGIFNLINKLKKDFPDLKVESKVAVIKDKNKKDFIFKEFSPEVIFHAAAYKHVPLMEEHPEEAVKNNILGTKVLADLSIKYNVQKFIFISTDKAVNPTSVMGASKRVGEMICRSLNNKNECKFISVRFGNVLDSRGSVIPLFKEQIRKGGPVEVTDPKMKRYFMTNSEACLLVLEAGSIGKGGEIFILDMGEPVMILDLAKEMIKLYGFEPDKNIPIVYTGIRPGEKLFEEILTAEEGTEATKSRKIFKAKLSEKNLDKLDETLSTLEQESQDQDKIEILNTLKKIIPNYGKDSFKNN